MLKPVGDVMAYLATLTEKQAKLAELQEVYDRAISGETEIQISQPNGGSTTYTEPNKNELKSRIRELEGLISKETGVVPASRRRAIGVFTG